MLASQVFPDDRGFFTEVFRADQFKSPGLPTEFVQDNHSGSVRGVLRGLHFQCEPPMGKLMRVTRGTAFLVAVDKRKGSPTLGKWFGRKSPRRAENRFGCPLVLPAAFACFPTTPRFSTSAPASTATKANREYSATIPRSAFSGSVLVPKLLDRGYEVDVLDLFWFGNHLPSETGIIRKDIFEISVPDLEQYQQVVFLAGLSNDPMAEYSPSENFIFNAPLPPTWPTSQERPR